jgi:hypothetical protein
LGFEARARLWRFQSYSMRLRSVSCRRESFHFLAALPLVTMEGYFPHLGSGRMARATTRLSPSLLASVPAPCGSHFICATPFAAHLLDTFRIQNSSHRSSSVTILEAQATDEIRVCSRPLIIYCSACGSLAALARRSHSRKSAVSLIVCRCSHEVTQSPRGVRLSCVTLDGIGVYPILRRFCRAARRPNEAAAEKRSTSRRR